MNPSGLCLAFKSGTHFTQRAFIAQRITRFAHQSSVPNQPVMRRTPFVFRDVFHQFFFDRFRRRAFRQSQPP